MGANIKTVSLADVIGYMSNEGYQWCETHMTSQCYSCANTRYATCVAETFPSKRTDSQYKELLESMRTQGFKGAVMISERGDRVQLMNGHHRIAAAAELGICDIPVSTDYSVADDPNLWPEDSTRNPKYRQRKWLEIRAERMANDEDVVQNDIDAQKEYKVTGIVPEGFHKCDCCDVMYYN